MDRADTAEWEYLQYHWATAYQFEYDDTPGNSKPFRVRRLDDLASTLEAGTPGELGDMIDEDYRRKPVPREVAP
jgi:hypothetical protein